ncbi:putative toxin-antitoxin system toxin component, PIN family [Muricoccus pecuniae]|uniref:putative toxin-antitoxin system toxin component, PIN family n=1 Tax=Muricoccus pecuniae TaxID=693023 RepID=UPI0028A90F38|nr:putative toxin-antitoxin system toxin component, PIN family [Roseomonas pecuniae]
MTVFTQYDMTSDMKFVVDTSVVVSGLQSSAGASRLLLAAIAERALRPLVTVPVVLEYEDVLLRPDILAKTGLSPDQTKAFIDAFIAQSEAVVVHYRYRPSIADPADEAFVEALLNGNGDAVVTFNEKDFLSPFPPHASRGVPVIQVIKPGEALKRLTWRPSAATPFASQAPSWKTSSSRPKGTGSP